MRGKAEVFMAQVVSAREAGTAIRELVIDLGGRVYPYQPGAHIDVDVLVEGRQETRSYSLLPAPGGQYRIGVKLSDTSKGGSRYMWSLKAGDRLRVTSPENRFELQMDRPEYLVIAGGVGITPVVGMARELSRRGARMQFLYAARNRAAMAFLDEVEGLAGVNLRLFEDAEVAFIDAAAEIAALSPGAQLYICGPMPLLDAVRRAWVASDRPLPDLRYEIFGDSGLHPTEEFEVVSADTGLSATVARNESIIDALARVGVDVISDCRRGECGLCAVPVLEATAEIDHRDVFFSDAQKAEGTRMCACVSRAVGGRVVIDTGFRAAAPEGVPAREAEPATAG
ncbi:oxidoreductase [Paroceanicella profunda]|uniref:Oxidoreductase n=1 Tax=Paroceanicella profunda TaxID=2579971 RepID=A0A5B8G1B4_9RHOB|nr:PDR/VanB family oxidoreductase [Paroceanicella profunda]QDL92979.1 oxidoreductase [Paroceanicella profunda]